MKGIEIFIEELLINFDIDVIVEFVNVDGNLATRVELIDLDTETTIGFCERSTFEEALFHLAAKCINDIKRVKIDYNTNLI